MSITKLNALKQITNMPGVDISGITLVTSQATTSGTAWDFTGIPSWVKRITVMFNGISTNGTSPMLIQIGDGSITTSGYLSTTFICIPSTSYGSVSTTAGFYIDYTTTYTVATSVRHGSIVIDRFDSTTWVVRGNITHTDNAVFLAVAGSKTLSGTLDRVRLTTVNGTDTGDAGSVSISYE